MCEEISTNFFWFTFLWITGLFTASLLNMIFAAITPKNNDTFKIPRMANYKDIFKYQFLNDFKFGKDLADKNEFNTSLSIEIECYLGKCKSGYLTYKTENCSKACFNEVKDCYYKGKKCDENICDKYIWKIDQSICHEYNRIKKWRDTEMFEYTEEYKIIPYSQIKPKNRNFYLGYKKCGKINKDGDFL